MNYWRGEVTEDPPLGECLEPRSYYSGNPPAPFPSRIVLGEPRYFSEGFADLPSLVWLRNAYGIPEGCYGLSSLTRQINTREDTAISEIIFVSIYPGIDLDIDVVSDAIVNDTLDILVTTAPLDIVIVEDSEVDDLGDVEIEPATYLLINASEVTSVEDSVYIGGNDLAIVKVEDTALSEILSVRLDLNINTSQGGKIDVFDEPLLLILAEPLNINVVEDPKPNDDVSMWIEEGSLSINRTESSTISDTNTIAIITPSSNLNIVATESTSVTETKTVAIVTLGSSGYNIVGTGATAGSGVAWNTPSRVTADDGLSTVATLTSANPVSQDLKGTNPTISLPPGAVIDGIQVKIQIHIQNAGSIQDLQVKLIVGGTIVGDNKAQYTYTGTAFEYVYGGATDLWGLTPIDTEIEAADFGVSLSSQRISGSVPIVNVDYMAINVFYHV